MAEKRMPNSEEIRMRLASGEITGERMDALRELFPEVFAEGGIDFDKLKLVLGEAIDEGRERYGLGWAGKAEAMRAIQAPSIGTLAPLREESVNFDGIANLMIEGDNLEVLKLLQKAYHGAVKMIYIDPPYNTGNEFIYPDNFREGLQDYLRYSGQVDSEGLKLTSNTETSGRYHSNWLSMMYPRLFLARNLLREDGVIFVSIDDHEVYNLRHLLDEVFGAENFVATIIWQKVYSPKNTARHFSEDHDYIVVYARSGEAWRPELLPRTEEMEARYSNPDNDSRGGIPHFSIEMETGTGKTYVYLRTLYELNRRYGFTKFIIVVPSVAIREGVLKNIELTREHFETLYGRVPVDARVYDSKALAGLRQFAAGNQIQVLIINIDAFNKDSNVLHQEQEQDRLSGRRPIEFIQETFPVVIVDEPQNMESDKAWAAIAGLNPLCMLRYSATHRNAYNLVYRLGPVAAYDRRLVKRIEVDSVLDEEAFNQPYVEVLAIKPDSSGPVVKLKIDVQGKAGPKRKVVTIRKSGTDLFDISKGRVHYRGCIVSEIDAAHGCVVFANGLRLYRGQVEGARSDDLMRVQIRRTIKEHFDKELAIRGLPEERRMKVLSLFFIDRVANYATEEGKIRRWFVEEYRQITAEAAYQVLQPPSVEQVHNGYFACDRKGCAKNTRGYTKADDAAYALIMRDKERLLSLQEPLRFIFSHSALREGWDNPNVFQICTLNETRSEVKKRQEIVGESLFLRKLVLGIPAQASGKNLTRPLMPSAPRPPCVRAAPPHHRRLGAGYAALPQMARHDCSGAYFVFPLALVPRTTEKQCGLIATGD